MSLEAEAKREAEPEPEGGAGKEEGLINHLHQQIKSGGEEGGER
jgi:hypothetical protein